MVITMPAFAVRDQTCQRRAPVCGLDARAFNSVTPRLRLRFWPVADVGHGPMANRADGNARTHAP